MALLLTNKGSKLLEHLNNFSGLFIKDVSEISSFRLISRCPFFDAMMVAQKSWFAIATDFLPNTSKKRDEKWCHKLKLPVLEEYDVKFEIETGRLSML